MNETQRARLNGRAYINQIRARLDAREAAATAARAETWTTDSWHAVIRRPDDAVVIYSDGAPDDQQIAHIVANDPGSVIDDVVRQRAMLEMFAEYLIDRDPIVNFRGETCVSDSDPLVTWTLVHLLGQWAGEATEIPSCCH